MAIPDKLIYTETRAPDLRYSTFLLIAIGYVVSTIVKSGRFSIRTEGDRLLAYCLSIFILWESMTANGRYVIPLGLLLGPALMFASVKIIRRPRTLSYFLVSLIMLQSFQIALGSDRRWNPSSWGDQWFEVSLPDELTLTPALYITVDQQSYSYLSMVLPDNSSYMNIGWVALDPEGPGKRSIHRLLENFRGRMRTLKLIELYNEKGDPMLKPDVETELALSRFGLRTVPNDCLYIWEGNDVGGSTITNLPSNYHALNTQHGQAGRGKSAFVSCAIIEDNSARQEYLKQVRGTEAYFLAIEKKCSGQFSPSGRITELKRNMQSRFYVNTDFMLIISADGRLGYKDFFNAEPVVFGNTSHFDQALEKLDCRTGHQRIPSR